MTSTKQNRKELNQECSGSVTLPMPTLAELDAGRRYYLRKSLTSLVQLFVLLLFFIFFERVFVSATGKTLEETGSWILVVFSFFCMPVLAIYSLSLFNKSQRYTPAWPWRVNKVKRACKANGREDLVQAIIQLEKRPYIRPTSGEIGLIASILEIRGAATVSTDPTKSPSNER